MTRFYRCPNCNSFDLTVVVEAARKLHQTLGENENVISTFGELQHETWTRYSYMSCDQCGLTERAKKFEYEYEHSTVNE